MVSSSELSFQQHKFGDKQIKICFRKVDEDSVNPYLFDEDFSPAVSTGLSKVWGGTHALVSFLQSAESACMEGHAVVELGAGLGLVGICAASRGCHVLMTDVSSVTQFCNYNITANSNTSESVVDEAVVPWQNARSIGRGSAACMELDWMKDVREQAHISGQDLSKAAYIIACEVIWLQELLQAYVNTLATLLHSSARPVCYMSYTIRGTKQSTVFTDETHARQAFKAAGCSVTDLPAFASVTHDGEVVVFWKVQAAS